MSNELNLLRDLAEKARKMRMTEAADPAFPATLKTFDDALVKALQMRNLNPTFDLYAHLQRQRDWSKRTFGPGQRTKGVVDHIRRELTEIEKDPLDVEEWIDVVILGLDGAWRAGATPSQIIATLERKQSKNEGRTWPDWRTADPDKAIEHDRSGDALKDWPRDPAIGRLLCTKAKPRPRGAPGSWAHAGAFVVNAGEYADRYVCRDCGADWVEELAE